MSSPFDYAKSLTQTKENLYTSEAIFNKEYVPFMVNRILSNSPQAVLFAECMNMYPDLDKKIQHDFYFYGIPKLGYTKMWSKKEEGTEDVMDKVKHIATELGVNLGRAMEIMSRLDEHDLEVHMKSRGGKVK